MTTTALTATEVTATAPSADRAGRRTEREQVRPITLGTLFGVELRKMFDTRSGFWLIASVAITATMASGAVMVWADKQSQTFETYASAIGIPMSILLPVIAILSVTSEWSQRTGLTTFALAPRRGLVIAVKMLCAVTVAAASMLLAMGIGAVGAGLGAAVHGLDPVWNFGLNDLGYVTLGNVLGVLMGFMFAVVLRNSPGAIVGYFVYSFVLPTISMVLANNQKWYGEHQQWLDFHYNQSGLFGGHFTATDWQQLAVTGVFWLVLPLAFGLWRVVRAEVK